MLYHRLKSFLHSGDRGDVIYSLPTIQAIGGGLVYLRTDNPNRRFLEDGSISLFTPEKTESLIPLLRSQPYIKDAKNWSGQKIDFDLDIFRRCRLDITNLADAHLQVFGINTNKKDTPWLFVEKNEKVEIIVARSARYHNHAVSWHEVYNYIKHRAAFVGTRSEHESFEQRIGPLPHLQTKDLLEVAQIIAGCKLFIGNQSCPYAIAEALKVNTIQEACPRCPNCVFHRRNALYLWGHVTSQDLKDWETMLDMA